MKYKLKIWRQDGPRIPGKLIDYEIDNVNAAMSLLETLDSLNEKLIKAGDRAIEFDSDCREGICGMCSLVINGRPHGPFSGTTTCQLYMRNFPSDRTITIEPFKAGIFPVIKDLVVDRSAFDKIIAAGGYISVSTGSAPPAEAILVAKDAADKAMDAAACIGCGACVAACPNASASLFVAAKIVHLKNMPQGHPERETRVLRMVSRMDAEGFGDCSNHGECGEVCPKNIAIEDIAIMRREYVRAIWKKLVGN